MLQLIFRERPPHGGLDLEAVEMAMRSALHRAGAALTELLQHDPPEPALGEVELLRPYFLCPHCHQGQSRQMSN